MPTPREFKKGYMSLPQLKRENGIWNIAAVRDILSNEVYAGTWRYGKRIGNSSNQRPMDQTIAVKVPAIVDRETWERAQVMRERNAQFSRRNRKYEYLLSGLIRCGKCNLSYTGDKGNTRLYYRCSSRVHRFAKLEHFCHGQVRADVIEFDIWREIDELFSDLDGLEADLKAAQEEERDGQGPKREELKAVEALIERTDREVIEIAEALPKARGRVGEVLQAKMEEANARYEALLAQRDQLKAGFSTEKLTDATIAEIMQYARAVQAGIIGADYITKRRFMEALGVKVFIQDGHYTLECVLGKAEGVISSVKRGGKIVIASKECSSSRCRRSP
jgi:site-specific DNA recombinase